MRKTNGSPFSNALGEKLKAHRLAAGLTRTEAAYNIGCSHDSIVNWERGKVIPNVQTVMLAAQVYGCTLKDLLPPADLA